nr:MAG TPA: hypothetical protein [Caudoviricetes sp.]
MMSVYEYGRETDNTTVFIADLSGKLIYYGVVDDIPYKLYNRKIARVAYDSELNCDNVVLARGL